MDYLKITIELAKKHNEEIKAVATFTNKLHGLAIVLFAISTILGTVDVLAQIEESIKWYYIALVGLLTLIYSTYVSIVSKNAFNSNQNIAIKSITDYQKAGKEMPLEEVIKILKRNII